MDRKYWEVDHWTILYGSLEKKIQKYELPKEPSSGIKTIDFKEDVPFSESEKLLIQHDLDLSKKHVQEIGLPTDRLDNLEK